MRSMRARAIHAYPMAQMGHQRTIALQRLASVSQSKADLMLAAIIIATTLRRFT
jgi:hypothetical protein